MRESDVVSIVIEGGPTLTAPFEAGMTVRAALEVAHDSAESGQRFTYGLQYYGRELGYLVMMINEVYDSFDISYEPDFYWEMRVNGNPARRGVDETRVAGGDTVSFEYVRRRGPEAPMAEMKREQRLARR